MNIQEMVNTILGLTPDFELSDFTNDDDEVTEATASWRNFGYPVSAVATVERIDGHWVLDGALRIDVFVDDDNGEDTSVAGLKDALERKQEDLVQVFACQYS